MIGRLALAAMLVLAVPAFGQIRNEAAGGVAASRIDNSPTTINNFSGMQPAEQLQLTDVFLQRITVSNEARLQAELRAGQLASQLGVTREAVIGFFRIVGEQDVPLDQFPI